MSRPRLTFKSQMVQVVSMLLVPTMRGSVSFQSKDVSGAQNSEVLFCTAPAVVSSRNARTKDAATRNERCSGDSPGVLWSGPRRRAKCGGSRPLWRGGRGTPRPAQTREKLSSWKKRLAIAIGAATDLVGDPHDLCRGVWVVDGALHDKAAVGLVQLHNLDLQHTALASAHTTTPQDAASGGIDGRCAGRRKRPSKTTTQPRKTRSHKTRAPHQTPGSNNTNNANNANNGAPCWCTPR